MTSLDPNEFFDLQVYRHKDLFDKKQHVWHALKNIAPYLKKQPLGLIEIEVPKEAYLINPQLISIGKGSVVEPGAYIKGPCIIGENCIIRHGAYIRGDLITGDFCVIGHDTEIKNAILLDHAHAAHFAYVGDSILGNKTNLGAGVKLANLKFANQFIMIHHEGQSFSTGLKKMGAIVGDGSQIGCNAVLNPGTLIGKGSCCYPCINFGGVLPAHHKVKNFVKIDISPVKL
jgi:NDP-sugar pyrophosphorylase family protein